MPNLFNISGPASALLLLAALLAADERFDPVTTAECAASRGLWGSRVRRYPDDSVATWINMHSCSLTGIEQGSIAGLPAVTGLELGNNKLRELPVFEEHACPNLISLFLYKNQLTSINNAGTFSACTKLEILNLGGNQIHFIHTSVFTALTNLESLYLHNNKIRFIPDQMFSNNGKLVKLHLYGNRLTHLPTDFASRLKRAAPSLDEFLFHDNPVHCACLIELLADVRRAGVRDYGQYKYDGTAPVCALVQLPRY